MFALSLVSRRWFSSVVGRRLLDPVLVERRGAVQVISLNRPDRRNAVNKSTAELLYQAFRGFDSDPGLSVAVLHGVGGCFCAGYDLKELAQAAAAGEDFSMMDPEDVGGGASPMVSWDMDAIPSSWLELKMLPTTPPPMAQGSHAHDVVQTSDSCSEWICCGWWPGVSTDV